MSNEPTAPTKRPPSDRGQGRKPIPAEDRAVNKSIRMKPSHWTMFDELGGLDWLRSTVEAAHKRLKKPR